MILAFKFLLFAILAAQFIDCEPQTRTIDVVTITWENIGARTIFNITANLSSKNIDPNNAWVAVGINTEKNMDGINAVVCQNTPNARLVNHHLNNAQASSPFDAQIKTLGISDSRIGANQEILVCSFARDNSNPKPRYHQVTATSKYYILVALNSKSFGFHGPNADHTNETVSFPLTVSENKVDIVPVIIKNDFLTMLNKFVNWLISVSPKTTSEH